MLLWMLFQIMMFSISSTIHTDINSICQLIKILITFIIRKTNDKLHVMGENGNVWQWCVSKVGVKWKMKALRNLA